MLNVKSVVLYTRRARHSIDSRRARTPRCLSQLEKFPGFDQIRRLVGGHPRGPRPVARIPGSISLAGALRGQESNSFFLCLGFSGDNGLRVGFSHYLLTSWCGNESRCQDFVR